MTHNERSWAKAPSYAGSPQIRAALRAETDRDRARYLEDGLTPVHCRRCGTCVLVKKNSPDHTSIQWSSPPAASCEEYAARAASGSVTAELDTCGDLQASIHQSVREGRLVFGGDP